MSETGDRPWWADVEHLRPGAEADASAPTGPETTQRTRRFDRPAATATVAVAELPRALDFDFDAGLASLLDPPAEPRGEWVELDLAAAPADPVADDRRAWLDDDDRASGWDLDLWSAEPAPRRDAVEPTHATDRLAAAPATTTAAIVRRRPAHPLDRFAGRPERLAMWAFILGLVLIAIAAIGTPKADAATPDAQLPQAPALVVSADAAP